MLIRPGSKRGNTIIAAACISAALVATGGAMFLLSPPEPKTAPPITGILGPDKTRALLTKAAPGFIFRECDLCPDMAVIPAGTFQMGGAYTDENPKHAVTIAAPFAMARTEITFDQWDACVAARGCGHNPSDEGWGRGTRPVINVSWRDAQQYAAWLSRITGARYRLPSEAEWEYAARAGSGTEYFWGDDIGEGNANCTGCGPAAQKQTAPTASFKPNAWGLTETAGNVFEWTDDCYHPTYDGAPADGSPWSTACKEDNRVLRGGSWSFDARSVRAAFRFSYSPQSRGGHVGFRVVRAP